MKKCQYPKITNKLECQGAGLFNVSLLFILTVANLKNVRVKRLKLAQSIRGLESANLQNQDFFSFFLFSFSKLDTTRGARFFICVLERCHSRRLTVQVSRHWNSVSHSVPSF